MPARLAALGHQYLSAGIQSQPRMLECLNLRDEGQAGGVDALRERVEIAEGQHDRRRLPFQRLVEHVGVAGQTPGDEATSDPCAVGQTEFARYPLRVGVAATDQAEATAAMTRPRRACLPRPAPSARTQSGGRCRRTR